MTFVDLSSRSPLIYFRISQLRLVKQARPQRTYYLVIVTSSQKILGDLRRKWRCVVVIERHQESVLV
jgi:hypothetical protein